MSRKPCLGPRNSAHGRRLHGTVCRACLNWANGNGHSRLATLMVLEVFDEQGDTAEGTVDGGESQSEIEYAPGGPGAEVAELIF